MSGTVEENLHRLNAARSLAHPQAQARASGEPKHLGLRCLMWQCLDKVLMRHGTV